MKKRVLSLFMTLMLCLTSLPTTALAEEQVVLNGTSTVEAVDGEGETEAGDEAEESGAENAMDEAVASVQDMIDALPEADTLSAMDENEVQAAYMAVQAAYDAYEALTAEQQAQVMGADCFEELFGWFNGQVAPLAEGTVTSWGMVNENMGDVEPSPSGYTRNCEIVDNTTTALVAPLYYMIPDSTNVELPSLNVQCTREQSVYLYLGTSATLTISGPLTFENGSCLYVYGASDGSGKIIINNTNSNSAAIHADDVSASSYLSVCGGTVEITSTSGLITNGVELVNGSGYSCRYMEYTIDGEPVAYNDNKDRLSGTAIEGTNLSLEWCDHDDVTYMSSGDTQHIKECAQCGFEGKAYDCGTDGFDGYVSGGDNGHYKQCPCGNTFGDLIPHVPSYLLTNNNTMHVSGCNDCGYTNGEEGTHIFPEGETEEYPLGECTVCGFAPVAESKGSALYDSVTEALKTIANDNNGADDYVRLNLSSYTHGVKTEIIESVEFNYPGKTVELQMNGHTLNGEGNPTLKVEDGTLRVTGDATINQTGKAELANSAVVVSGGKLIFEGKLSAEGSSYNNSPAVKVNGGELEFNGDLNLNGGLVLSGGAKLTEKLTQGTFLATGGDTPVSVSVVGSEEYKNLYDLLEEGYGFKDSSTGKFVGGDDNVNTLIQNVTIEKHTHEYQPVTGADYYQCECGKTCLHKSGYTDGVCSVCGKSCLHEQVTTVDKTTCDDCGLQMLVRIEKKDPTDTYTIRTYSADFMAAVNAAEDGTKITLLADIKLQKRACVTGDDKTVTLDLNRHTISGGWIDVGVNDVNEYTSSTLKITGNGSFEKSDASYGGRILVAPKATLDLSEWKGSTIGGISVMDHADVSDDKKAGLIIGTEAGTIQELQFGSNQSTEILNIKLSGGSYDQIWVADNIQLPLGKLLEVGYAFQYAGGTYVEYTKTLKDEYVYNVEVVKCPHEKVDDGTCVYCGTTGIVATLDGEAYTDIETAVNNWLDNGGLLKLYREYPYNASIDFHRAEGESLTIDLNGYQFNVDKNVDMPEYLMGADLTIMDTSESGAGMFGKLNANEGKLTLESGTLEELSSTIDVMVQPSPVTISLHGGKFTAGAISYHAYKMLEGGYYLLEDGNNFVNPGNEDTGDNTKWQFRVGKVYEVKKADITVDGAKTGEIEIGKNQVPFAATVKVNDSCTEVQFSWYLVNDKDGKLAELAESSYVTLTNGTATYDVKTDGSAYAEEGWNDVALDKTYNLICVVTGSTGDKVQWHTVWKGYELTMLPPSLEGAKIAFEDDTLTFLPDSSNNSAGATQKVRYTVTLGDETLVEGTDYTVVDNSDSATEVGEYTLTIQGEDPYYSGTVTAEWKVEPYRLGSIELKAVDKQYDGTDSLPEGAITNKFESKESNGAFVTLNEGTDYEITESHLTTADASGDAKDFVVKITLTNPNYVFEDGTTEKTVTKADCNVTIKVNKADASTVKEGTLNVMNNRAHSYTVDLPVLPTLISPMEYGTVTYTIDSVNLGDYYDAAKGKATIEDGKLILPIQAVDTETEDAIGTVTVTVSSTNIQDITLTINVNATNKIVPTGTPGFSKTELTYGDPLSAISISGTMTDPITNEVVTGAFEWNTPNKTMDAVGTYEATWKFTPDNAGVYAVVTGTVNITVNKATLTGAPKYTTISTSGKKLSDAALTVNDKWPAGTLEWVDEEGNVLPGATEVKVNTIYKWRFTPTDTNYNALTGEVELYHEDAPAISAQPVNASVKAGEKAVFEVTATGTNLTYQWKINRNDGKGFVNISSANSASYTSGITDTDCNGFQYYCVISNAAGSVTTDTVTLTVTVQYDILNGADSSWTGNTDGSLAIRGSGDIGKFLRVLVDGKVVDPNNYIVTEGSTIITFKPEFLKTLSEGSHSFEIVWTDGTASTSFTVAKNTSGNNGGNNNNNNNSNNNSNNDSGNNAGSSANTTDTTIKAPKTGDTSNDALWIVLLVVASIAGLAGFAEILAIRKKKDFE